MIDWNKLLVEVFASSQLKVGFSNSIEIFLPPGEGQVGLITTCIHPAASSLHPYKCCQ
jgi:hypothetical protein